MASALALGSWVAAGPAYADKVRCVGAPDLTPAFACYTSPRIDHAGLDQAQLLSVESVCFAYGCTSPMVGYYTLGTPDGRFTAVSYFGHSYTVYRPTSSQPYVLLSDNPRASDAETAQVLLLAAALDAANQ